MKSVKLMNLFVFWAVGAGFVADTYAGWWNWRNSQQEAHRNDPRPPTYRCGFGEADMDGDTAVLFYDSSSTSRDAKRAFNKVRRRSRDVRAPIEFKQINVEKRKYTDCEDAYSLDGTPTVAFFEGGATHSYSVLEGDDITTKRLTRFVERQGDVDLRKRERDDRPRRSRARVGIGIGIGAPYWGGWGGPYYGGWGWRGRGRHGRCRHCR